MIGAGQNQLIHCLRFFIYLYYLFDTCISTNKLLY